MGGAVIPELSVTWPVMSSAGSCDSCGADPMSTDDLVSVQRVYLVVGEQDTVGAERVTMLDDIEAWCFVCRTMYPHQLITAS